MKETKKRVRRYYSLKNALLLKAKEAALAAVQIFNSPTITFKSEIFIVLMQIAWTYLLHAYFKEKVIQLGKKDSAAELYHSAFRSQTTLCQTFVFLDRYPRGNPIF